MQQRALINAGIGSVHGNNPINIVNNEDRQIASIQISMAGEQQKERAAVAVRIPM